MTDKELIFKNWSQEELTNFLHASSQLYYKNSESNISDATFDLLLKELQYMEKSSGSVLPNSPTQRVGSDLRTEFGKIKHPEGHPMLTIENVYSDDELELWLKKIHEEYNVAEFEISFKYDGISCELHYVDGCLFEASTRGDRLIGDDITENVKTIQSIPLYIPNLMGNTYIRGEILLPKSCLARLNDERRENGEKEFSNCRNACSGSIKQLDSRITAKRGLIFRAWDAFGDGVPEDYQTRISGWLSTIGFEYRGGESRIADIDSVINFVRDSWGLTKENFDYDCDGIVIKINDKNVQAKIGLNDVRAVEWAIARKFNEEYMSQTIVRDVVWQVGKTGVITPVATLEPVECGGVIISNVTLNNLKFIRDHELAIGDTIEITRSGGVIPQLINNLSKGKDGRQLTEAPSVCPECGGEVEVTDTGLVYCMNSKCSRKTIARLIQWCSKDCMDIDCVGPSVIEDLYRHFKIQNGIALYHIANNYDAEGLAEILGAGYGFKKTQKIIDSINVSKDRGLSRFIYACAIEGVGKVTARLLAKHYQTFEKFTKATVAELQAIDSIGEIVANDIYKWIQVNGEVFLDQATRLNITLTEAQNHEIANQDQVLKGLTIVFTGKSKKWLGDAVEEELEKMGCKCTHSVTKKINYLVTGEKPGGSKVKKAQELSIDILTEDEFLTKFGIK